MFSGWGYNNGSSEAPPATEDTSTAAETPAVEPKSTNVTDDSSNDQGNDDDTPQSDETGNEKPIPSSQDKGSDADRQLEHFMGQLERMTESHQLEMDELQRTHKMELNQLQEELTAERELKKNAKARNEVASQDKFLKQMRALEKKFSGTIREQEDQISDLSERNEGLTLKMNTLKREVDGLTKIVDERDEEIARLKQGHGNTMMQVEGKVKMSKEELSRRDGEIGELRVSLMCMLFVLYPSNVHLIHLLFI